MANLDYFELLVCREDSISDYSAIYFPDFLRFSRVTRFLVDY